MAKVFKVRLKSACGNCPKGYEMQVITSTTAPNTNEVIRALKNAGFNPGASCVFELI
jgi:hypothetical protein